MSWEQLGDIVRNDADERQQLASQPPTNCPNDGTQLQSGPNGELHCPFDGWIWNGESVTW